MLTSRIWLKFSVSTKPKLSRFTKQCTAMKVAT